MTQDSGIWYHGSTRLFNRFILPRKYSPSEQLGFGIHFAKKREFAGLYGKIIYQCKLHPKKVLNLLETTKVGTERDAMAKEFYRGSRYKPYMMDKTQYVFNPDMKSPKRAEEIIRKYGYDAIIYEAKYGTRTFDGRNHGAIYSHQSPGMVMLDNTRIEIVGHEP
jgi:hypothetical protein